MLIVTLFGIITVLSVVFALRKQKAVFLGIPIASIFVYMLIKIAMVPMPFMDTVRFVIGLR